MISVADAACPRPIGTRYARGDRPSRLRIAHYFGDHDPFGFWASQDFALVSAHLAQIRNDGFNAIIAVVPAYPFLPNDVDPIDPWYLARLDSLLHQAERAGLDVVLRLHYPHNSKPFKIHSADRAHQLATSQGARDSFARYLAAIAAVACKHASFADVFLCWEDFWAVFDDIPRRAAHEREHYATASGFSGDAVPEHQTYAMAAWIEHFDHFLQNTLGEAVRAAFGSVSFEVRADRYPVLLPGGGYDWLPFNVRASSDDAIRYAYWAPYYGAQNQGEQLSAEEAMRGLRYLVDSLAGRRNAVLEQFNFTDSTLSAANNARVAPTAMSEFLSQAAEYLAESALGFGVWAYRDYQENWLHNCTFQRGLEDWRTNGKLTVRGLTLAPQGWLSKRLVLANRAQALSHLYGDITLEIHVGHAEDASVSVQADNHAIASATLVAGINKIVLKASSLLWSGLVLRLVCTRGHFRVFRLALYGYVHQGGIYDAMGVAGPYLDGIRAMNARLAQVP